MQRIQLGTASRVATAGRWLRDDRRTGPAGHLHQPVFNLAAGDLPVAPADAPRIMTSYDVDRCRWDCDAGLASGQTMGFHSLSSAEAQAGHRHHLSAGPADAARVGASADAPMSPLIGAAREHSTFG